MLQAMSVSRIFLAMTFAGCNGKTTDSGSTIIGTHIEARVIDVEDAPVEDAYVLMGGWPEARWVQTDADGIAQVQVVDDGWAEQYLLAGKPDSTSGGVRLDFDNLPTEVEIRIQALPSLDNSAYHFQPGGDGSSPDTSECGHCHWTIGDDWAGSAHANAASRESTWDIYTGSTRSVSSADCSNRSGWLADGLVPGTPAETQERCYTGQGVLPWLNSQCGHIDQPACDHPDERDTLTAFGSCADCHAPAIDGGVPGQLDLGHAIDVGFEGVTCDFCHKVQSVTPGARPGLDGAITLLRPSEETFLPNQEYRPLTFGPYPDVIVPIMNGIYTPQFKESEWCSACHEYAQPALHPEQELSQADRWPDGLPIFETWSEYNASKLAGQLSCQECHMPALDEESSTYDITPLGLEPSVDQGWVRASGEVRHHGFNREGLGSPTLSMEISEVDGELEVIATVTNNAAGHAIPTGEPMKQLLVRIYAQDTTGAEVQASGGHAIPDVGGYRATGILGDTLEIIDGVLTLEDSLDESATNLVVRFTRPTGTWEDYTGPGTAAFSTPDLTAEDKGLELEEYLGEVEVLSTDGWNLELEADLPDIQMGDRFYVATDGDQAGAPGWLYGKILVDAEGSRGVPHYRAIDVASDNRIAQGNASSFEARFPLLEEKLTIEAQLIRRDHGAYIAELYGWTTIDELITTTTETFVP